MAAIAHAVPPAVLCSTKTSPRFRLVKHGLARWDVQKHIGCWVPIYSDDSADRAYGELLRVSAVTAGEIVCASCMRALEQSRLRCGEVLCDGCHSLTYETWFPLVGLGVLGIIWIAILSIACMAIQKFVFGGVRW